MRQLLDRVILQNTVEVWLLALLVAVFVFAGLRVLKGIVVRRFVRLAGRTQNDVDDIIARALERTKVFFLFLVSVYAGARVLTLAPESPLERALEYVFVTAFVLQVGIWGEVVITAAVQRRTRAMLEDDAAGATTLNAFGFVIRIGLWAVLILMGLANLGIQITPLLTGLGIGGIAVALALQNILGDLFASLSIALDKPFVIGDFIIVGDLLGTVEHVGLKTTRVRSLSGEQLVFSNTDLLGSRIRNFKRMYERRVVFTLGVTYQTPYTQLEAIPGVVRGIVEAQSNTRFDRSHFKGYGDFSLNFETVYYVLVPDYNTYMDIQQAINLEIYRAFEAERIEFAYPTQTVFLEPTAAAAPAEAAAAR